MRVRIFGSIFVIGAIAIGAYVFALSTKAESPASTHVQTVEQQANEAVAAANLRAAAAQLEVYRASSGSYEGATLPPAFAVTVVRADAGSYCVQTSGAFVQHETGPGGSPEPGPC